MEVLISGDFASDFNDGENLRNSFALSPELISKSQRSQELNFAQELILEPYIKQELRDF